MHFSILFMVCILFSSIGLYLSSAEEWNYEDLGPDVWPDFYPTCGEKSQSPINIKTACTTYRDFPPFQFSAGYDTLQDFTIKNNGHTVGGVQVNATEFPLILSGGGLTENFTFVNFHLHWGENYATGSEHQLNGKKYSGEIHFVHRNAAGSQYAALGIFIESKPSINAKRNNREQRQMKRQISSTDNATLVEWEIYLDASDDLNQTNATTVIGLQLMGLFEENLGKFYRYSGSLTVPPCTENVIWTVFEKPVIFSEDELHDFRTYIFRQTAREPQPLYERIVYRNFFNTTMTNISDYKCCEDNLIPNRTNQSSVSSTYRNSILVMNTHLFIYSALYFFIFYLYI